MEQEPKKPQPQPQHLVDEVLDYEEQQWQDLIDSIEATDVPIEMLKFLRVHLNNGSKMVFPIVKWKKEGAEYNDIKVIVSDWYKKHNSEILGSDFIVNLTKLKDTVKLQTQRVLKDL